MSDDLNFHRERSRLGPEAAARWGGLPLCWVDVGGTVRSRIVNDHPVIALIDDGAAQADIAFGLRRTHLDVSAGAMGLFEAGESRVSTWRCASARRAVVRIDLPWLAGRGLLNDELRTMRLRQELQFHDPALAGLIRLMVREAAEGSPNGALAAESLSLGLVMRLAATHRAAAAPRRERGRLTPAQRRRVDELIEHHIDGALPLSRLAEAAGCSAPHFTRLFRATFGESPHQHVLGRRLAHAQRLLQDTDLPLAAVALGAGFASQSHMNAVFARRLATTPRAVRAAGRRAA